MRRSEIDRVLDLLLKGSQVIVIHSMLGNGKSLLCQGVAHKASQAGFDVYEFERERGTTASECSRLREATRPTLVIIENYQENFDAIANLRLGNNTHIRLLLSCRTPTHLTHWRQLRELLPGQEVPEIEVDRLSGSELQELDTIMEHNGLLGDLASFDREARLQRLRGRYNSELREILLAYSTLHILSPDWMSYINGFSQYPTWSKWLLHRCCYGTSLHHPIPKFLQI